MQTYILVEMYPFWELLVVHLQYGSGPPKLLHSCTPYVSKTKPSPTVHAVSQALNLNIPQPTLRLQVFLPLPPTLPSGLRGNMGWMLCVWQMFSDNHLRVCSLSVCMCVREVVFSSHLDSLNGSVDINLFSWMAIARHLDGNHSLSSWGSKANKCNTAPRRWCVFMYMCVCVLILYMCIFVHVDYTRTHPLP